MSCASTVISWPQLPSADTLLANLEPACCVISQLGYCPAMLPVVLCSLSEGVQWLPSHGFGKFPVSEQGLWRSQMLHFQRPMDQLCMPLCLAKALGKSTWFLLYLYSLETEFSSGCTPTALGLLCCFFKQCIPTYADGCIKQDLTSQGGSLWMEMREIFLFKVGGECYWRKEGIIVPKTFWQELAKTQLSDPDKIMMIPLAAWIVSV